MLVATEIRVGTVLRLEGKACQVLSQEMRGTGKFGKTIHCKLKGLEDGHIHEISLRAEDKAEDIDVHKVKMQYLYREKDDFIFMNTENFEQFPLPSKVVGKQEVFLKENTEIDVLFDGERPLTIDFAASVDLKVAVAPPAVKGQTDSTYKEVELENGIRVLVPQFVKEGETVRIDTHDFSYLERITTKSLKHGKAPDS